MSYNTIKVDNNMSNIDNLSKEIQKVEARSKDDDFYQEIEYLAYFDGESLISNLGGFIGIFLGYSMMQFPELVGMY